MSYYENAISMECTDQLHEALTEEMIKRGSIAPEGRAYSSPSPYIGLAAQEVAWQASINPKALPIEWHRDALAVLKEKGDDPLGLYGNRPQSSYFEARKRDYFAGMQLGAYVAQKFLQEHESEVVV